MMVFQRRFTVFFLLAIIILTGICHAGADQKPLVLIIGTGGTISEVMGKEGLRPEMETQELVKKAPGVEKYARLDIVNLFKLDSTNIQPGDWVKMAQAIEKAHNRPGVKGVVITHGTDTMAYTAAALSFMVQNPRFPIVLTGAMKSMDAEGSDAPRNLINAVQYAAKGRPGVYVVFAGKVIKGVRVSKINSSAFDAFDSINEPPVARFEGAKGKLIETNPVKEEKPGKATVFDTKIDPKVQMIRLTPGFDPDWLRSYCNPYVFNGLIIEGFGMGNIPNREPYNLIPSLEELQKAKIPVVVVSQCPYGPVDMQIYEVGQDAKNTGVIPGGNMTKEDALAKLMWVLGHTRDMDEVKKMMMTDIAGELK